ncbi:hypothetical protein AB1Y20_019583 [Prymnesium parvum]|uniref:ATP-dependent RNA helicase n=1 Tax=Prymnesium parvum TaxID=97485 RepID=A0AB34JUI2_PRYPA
MLALLSAGLLGVAAAFALSGSTSPAPHRTLPTPRHRNIAAAPPPPPAFTFDALDPRLRPALRRLGHSTPFEAQRLAWRPLRAGEDALLLSEAGSGKTLAYLLPLLDAMLSLPDESSGHLLVAVPTQDLAAQVEALARALCAGTPLRVSLASSRQPSNVAVGTLPAAAAWLRATVRSRRGGSLRVVVDEADVCLAGTPRKAGKAVSGDAGIAQLLAAAGGSAGGGERRTQLVLVSATLPAQGSGSVGAYVQRRFPRMRWLRTEGAHRPVGTLAAEFVAVDRGVAGEREAALIERLASRDGRALVFANSASGAVRAAKILRGANLECGLFTPQMSLEERSYALNALRKDKKGVLVCSGLASRGIDFDVDLVIQYDLAPNIVEYMHRVGRTARGGHEGRAVSFVCKGVAREEALQKEVERCVRGSWKFL